MGNYENYQFPFEKLSVWEASLNFAVEMYHLAKSYPKEEQFEIASQLRRSSFSAPNNLAEGAGRRSAKERARYTETSYNSLMEVMNILILSEKVGLIQPDVLMNDRTTIHGLSNQLNALYNKQIKLHGERGKH